MRKCFWPPKSGKTDFPQVGCQRLPALAGILCSCTWEVEICACQHRGDLDYKFGFISDGSSGFWFFFGFFGCCKLALFCYKKTLLLWFQRIVKVSLLCLQSQYCLLFVPGWPVAGSQFPPQWTKKFQPMLLLHPWPASSWLIRDLLQFLLCWSQDKDHHPLFMHRWQRGGGS